MTTDRPLASATRPMRLPVWPLWSGRVTPMQLPVEASDPFLMLVHHRHSFSRWDPVRPFSAFVMPEGFPAHPHRGFETVTYVLDGGMRHRDSTGVKMTYKAGSAQWLTAGRGVLHEEMWDTSQSTHELYQIWVNLPSAHKLDPPEIQLAGPADVEDGPGVTRTELTVGEVDGARITVLGGSCRGITSPVRTRSPMTIARLEWAMPAGFQWDDLPGDHTAIVYVRKGAVDVAGKRVAAGGLGWFAPSRSPGLRLAALEPGTDVMLLTGQPLREPIAMGGSMVMNTVAEVDRAHADFQRGGFGATWPHSASDAAWRKAIGR